LTLELYTADAIHVDAPTWMHRRHLSLLDLDGRVCDLAALIERAPIVKAQWIVEDEALAERLATSTPPSCFAASAGSHAMSKVRFITLTRTGVDKGDAVRWVASHLGVDVAECAAVGDSSGDVPMLEAVGWPYVMADAPAWLRARFSVLPSVAEHGVMGLFEVP
jgi:hydroxymethylpyrimidine pyrophosphatase-like HAD family hydrolase